MKQLIAIGLLALFAFNLIGYRACFFFLQQKADVQLQAALDKDSYNEKDLITLQVPLSLPYQTDWADFEKVEGSITINGQSYKYVKRKVFHGNMILLCLPDPTKMKLETARDEFFKLANDLQSTPPVKKSSSQTSFAFNILSDYDCPETGWSINKYKLPVPSFTSLSAHILCSYMLDMPPKPPEAV